MIGVIHVYGRFYFLFQVQCAREDFEPTFVSLSVFLFLLLAVLFRSCCYSVKCLFLISVNILPEIFVNNKVVII